MTVYKFLNLATFYILIASALNGGFTLVFKTDLIGRIFGVKSFVARILYILMVLSALYILFWKP